MADPHASDIAMILARRRENGADFWAGPDGRVYVGHPYSTLGALLMLHELGVPKTHEVVRGALDLVWNAWRDDGRIKLGPTAPLYPCYTAEAARVLCRYGFAGDHRLQDTAAYFLENGHDTGGWRCQFTRFGKGPETLCANPGATLFVLDALRFMDGATESAEAEHAVGSLLDHWDVRKPIGPCHYGIGTMFMQVEYPFLRYNLFYYVYVLSFFPSARRDERFHDALGALKSKFDDEGRVVVERPHRALKDLAFCAKDGPSELASARYGEIERNATSP